jgi:hypothetical protein
MKKLVYIGMMLLLMTVKVIAQKKCKDALSGAEKLYNQGQIAEAIQLLEPCSKRMSKEDERFESFRLLGLCYQFQNNEKKALNYVSQMLKMRPEYQKYPNIDPLEFTELVNRFEVRPMWYLGAKVGININSVRLMQNYSMVKAEQVYYPTVGYQFGITGEYMYKRNISFSTELLMDGRSVHHDLSLSNGEKQVVTESQQYVNWSGWGNYYIIKGKWAFSTGLGLGVNYLTTAIANFESHSEENTNNSQASKNSVDERTHLQPTINVKVGVSYEAYAGTFGLELGYAGFLRNVVDSEKRFSNQEWIFNNQYVSSDYSLDAVVINLSYKLPLKMMIRQIKNEKKGK